MCNCVTIVGLLTRCSIPSVCLLHDCLIVAGHDTQEAEAWQHSTYCVTSQHLCICQPDQPIVSRHDTGHYVATFIGSWHGIYVWYTDEMLTTDPNMLDSSLSLPAPWSRAPHLPPGHTLSSWSPYLWYIPGSCRWADVF